MIRPISVVLRISDDCDHRARESCWGSVFSRPGSRITLFRPGRDIGFATDSVTRARRLQVDNANEQSIPEAHCF